MFTKSDLWDSSSDLSGNGGAYARRKKNVKIFHDRPQRSGYKGLHFKNGEWLEGKIRSGVIADEGRE